jgi:N-acetylglutamate synthase-like GNAT family acetyltransferase
MRKTEPQDLGTMTGRHIQFCAHKSKIDLHQLQALFNATAFWAQERQMEDLEIAIANSDPAISVWDGDRLIGFARATSDGIYRAAIWDVVIHPDYQGAGLGSKLVETVLSHPRVNRVERVYLMTTHQQQFYRRVGFQENPSTTLILYNTDPVSSFSEPHPQMELLEANTLTV